MKWLYDEKDINSIASIHWKTVLMSFSHVYMSEWLSVLYKGPAEVLMKPDGKQ